MGSPCLVSPDRITQLPEKVGKDFYLLIPPAFAGLVSLANTKVYNSVTLLICRNHEELYELMQRMSSSAHVFYLPNTDHSGFKLKKENLQPKQSIVIFNLTRFPQNWLAIKKFFSVMENTNIDSQITAAEYFFERVNQNPKLYFRDFTYNTEATFEIDDYCQFNELYGYVKDQQIETTAPSGEIAITSNEPFNIVPKPLRFNGELCLQSYPLILLSGIEPFVREVDQQRIYKNLTSLVSDPIIATFKNGMITNLAPTKNNADLAALRSLSALIEVDERYAVLTEIGLGLNTECSLELNNCGLMEVYGHNNYCVHFGFGNHNTSYHIDLICPNTKIIINGETLNFINF